MNILNLNCGVQPLDQILKQLGLKNTDLVEVSTAQLTHRMVAKGRKGRRLGRRIKVKILSALNIAQTQTTYQLQDLFNY